jgi:hypothetical protein
VTRIVRWTHLPVARNLAVLWVDGLCDPPRLHRTVVEPDHDIDGTRLLWVSGEPLPDELHLEIVHDLHRAEDDTGFAPKPVYYAGVQC